MDFDAYVVKNAIHTKCIANLASYFTITSYTVAQKSVPIFVDFHVIALCESGYENITKS